MLFSGLLCDFILYNIYMENSDVRPWTQKITFFGQTKMNTTTATTTFSISESTTTTNSDMYNFAFDCMECLLHKKGKGNILIPPYRTSRLNSTSTLHPPPYRLMFLLVLCRKFFFPFFFGEKFFVRRIFKSF